MTRTDLTGADGQHWQQAVESLLPVALRAPWLSPGGPEQDEPHRDATGGASVTASPPGSGPVFACRCGCGELLVRAPAGRTRLFVDHAHRERAYRASQAVGEDRDHHAADEPAPARLERGQTQAATGRLSERGVIAAPVTRGQPVRSSSWRAASLRARAARSGSSPMSMSRIRDSVSRVLQRRRDRRTWACDSGS